MNQNKFLIIQTAFIGDAILATALLEKLHIQFPEAQIDYLIRKGNESLFENHPFINQLYVWDKKGGKYRNLFRILKEVKKQKYNYVINLQRFASTGLFTVLSGAIQKIGYTKNPFSFLFDINSNHNYNKGKHEIERNQLLISHLGDLIAAKPRLYPSEKQYERTNTYKSVRYICISPASVWFTKQFPVEKWVEFVNKVDEGIRIYFLGAPSDSSLCDKIANKSSNKNIENLAGKLSLLESAALMQNALMNYTNDSAPMHLASAMDAPTTAIFCSTVPEFGFGPLSSTSIIVETREKLECRPCGLHGKKSCPKGHFKCGYSIDIEELLIPLKL
jgi:lipopolysaccharide heptosyltransferase II